MQIIGKVTIDDSLYGGKDLYSDGPIEDELLRIATEVPSEQWNSVIAQSKSWPILYHFSHIRENIAEGIPFKGNEKVLEIGAGCGAITGALCRKAAKVDAIDLSMKRSLVNANRNRDCDNLTIHVGNFQDIEKTLTDKYDVITLIGVFEYGKSYIDANEPYRTFLEIVKSHLTPCGTIAIAIENRYGLKYWAGCSEDHTGRFSDGLEGYCNGGAARTFGKKELGDLLEAAGLNHVVWRYPYPDYKLPLSIYSDSYLPKVGELRRNLANFDQDRLLLFDEGQTWDGIVANDQFPFFSNSFLILAGESCAIDDVVPAACVWMSNDRAPENAIVTKYYDDPITGGRIEKSAANETALDHIEAIENNHDRLKAAYAGTDLRVAGSRRRSKSLEVDYLQGVPLSKVLDELITAGDTDKANELLDRFIRTVTGEIGRDEVISYTDIDIIPQNVLYIDDKFYVYDCEWPYEMQLTAGFMRWRILNYTIRSAKEIYAFDGIYEKYDITTELKIQYQEQETAFQKKVGGGRKSLSELYADIHGRTKSLPDMDGIAAEYSLELERTGRLDAFFRDKSKQNAKLIKLSRQPITMYDGRDYEKVYDYLYYLANNQDVLNAFGGDITQTLRHFVEFGMKEGRQGCACFNPKRYKLERSDLRLKYGDDWSMYYRHYMKENK